MQNSPETLDLNSFDNSFFESLENEMDFDLTEVAREALSGILTTKDENDAPDYEAIKQQTEIFFANPLVAQDMQLLNTLAMDYARACAGHSHEAQDYLNSGSLGEIYKKGKETSNSENTQDEEDKDDDYEIDPITGKRVRKKRIFWEKPL